MLSKNWSRLGGQLGVGMCTLGFLFVFLGWNGAASVDRVPSQFPYLISGGVAGLCFVVIGVGMIVVQNQRTDRAELQATLRQLQATLERSGGAAPEGSGELPGIEFIPPEPRPTPAHVLAELTPKPAPEAPRRRRARPVQAATRIEPGPDDDES